MPMYEYRCDDCQGITEELRSMSSADKPTACAHCGFAKTRRVQSVFAACGTQSGTGVQHQHTPGGCCPCGKPGGGCGM